MRGKTLTCAPEWRWERFLCGRGMRCKQENCADGQTNNIKAPERLFSYTLARGFDFNGQQTGMFFCRSSHVCNVCALLGWAEVGANTRLSPAGCLIYKASNEVQQRGGARTSCRLIVCLFTFLSHSRSRSLRRAQTRGIWVEIISSTCE